MDKKASKMGSLFIRSHLCGWKLSILRKRPTIGDKKARGKGALDLRSPPRPSSITKLQARSWKLKNVTEFVVYLRTEFEHGKVTILSEMIARVFLALGLALPIAGLAQSFSGNFEHLQPNGIPTQWSIADASGAATSTDAHLGKHAAKAWVYRGYASGVWTSRTDAENNNAATVTGYYKYLGEKNECERANVSYIMAVKDAEGGIDTLAFGDTELKLSKSYRKFSLDVEATGSGTPEFMSIQIRPAGHCNPHGADNCCFLFVDDIVLEGSTDLSQPAEEAPAGEGKKRGRGKEAPVEEVETPPTSIENKGTPTEDAPAPEEEEAAEEAAPAKVATPAKAEPAAEEGAKEAPAEEEGPDDTVEEGWNSEESSDGGR